MVSETFGQELRKLRRKAGLSLVPLANYIGRRISYVSDLERGRVAPPETQVVRDLVYCMGMQEEHLKRMIQLAKRERSWEAEYDHEKDVLRVQRQPGFQHWKAVDDMLEIQYGKEGEIVGYSLRGIGKKLASLPISEGVNEPVKWIGDDVFIGVAETDGRFTVGNFVRDITAIGQAAKNISVTTDDSIHHK